MVQCSVKKCKNNSRNTLKKVAYFRFPRHPVRCAEWTYIIARDRKEQFYKPSKGSVVCSEHFQPSDIYNTDKGIRRLTKNAKPILNMSYDHDGSKESPDNAAQADYESVICFCATSLATQDPSSKEGIEENSINEKTQLSDNPLQCTVQDVKIEQLEKSPTTSSLSIDSILDSAEQTVLKIRLNKCQKLIVKKNRQINTLQKHNKRLIKKNIRLKKTISILKKREKALMSLHF